MRSENDSFDDKTSIIDIVGTVLSLLANITHTNVRNIKTSCVGTMITADIDNKPRNTDKKGCIK